MGREIEKLLRERGHEAALIIDCDNAQELDAGHLRGIDVAQIGRASWRERVCQYV